MSTVPFSAAIVPSGLVTHLFDSQYTKGGHHEVADTTARDAIAGLPEPKDTDGELVPVEGLQVAGRQCAKSGKAISFERDARLCPNCGQVYHHTSVPKRCMTCKAELGEKAIDL